MTETYTAGSVKITLPSNYAENRRGSEVTLSFSFEDGTTCEQADEITTRVRRLCLRQAIAGQTEVPGQPLSLSVGESGFSASAAVASSKEAAPEKTAASGATEAKSRSKAKPSEIVIGAPAEVSTKADDAATVATSQVTNGAPPFVAAPTEQQPARPSFAQPEATVSPPTPATTGTAVQHNPFAGSAAPVAQLAPEPVSTAAGISDEELTALSIEQAKRINGILPQQGGNIVNQVIARYVQPPRGLKSIPVEQRAAYVAELQAWSPT